MKPMEERHYTILRRHMVELIEIRAELLDEEIGKDRFDARAMAVMRRLPRHRFVPAQIAPFAYQDSPLPIGFEKTISQPFICALMTDLLAAGPQDSVLEIGTGCGYQSAILAELAAQVWSVEIVEELGTGAETTLQRMGYANVHVRIGDGSRGWAEHAPFDRIMVTAGAEEIPRPLVEQLAPGGRLVMPLGPDEAQHLVLVEKTGDDGVLRRRPVMPVRFSRLETVI